MCQTLKINLKLIRKNHKKNTPRISKNQKSKPVEKKLHDSELDLLNESDFDFDMS